MASKKNWKTYSVLKVSEGGYGQKQCLAELEQAGIECEGTTSPYVGHTGVVVFGGARVQRKAERLLGWR